MNDYRDMAPTILSILRILEPYMDTYCEIIVPIYSKAEWLKTLGSKIPEDLKKTGNSIAFHVTIAYMKNTTAPQTIADSIKTCIRGEKAQTITFDKLDAFTALSGKEHIVYLSSNVLPQSFLGLVKKIRNAIEGTGGKITTNFRFHVTIYRISAEKISLPELQQMVDKVVLPKFQCKLCTVKYMAHGCHKPIWEWELE